jgi:aryl-phospho-beta-D-glucosidase BglC (GH1 family)
MPFTTLLPRREFLRTSAIVAGGLAAVQRRTVAANSTGDVPAARLERLRTGANVCRWFRYPQAETAEHFGGYLGDDELKLMASLGLRHVRLCIAPKLLMDAATGAIREDRIGFVEQALRRFHRAGLLVIVDPHNEDRDAELNPAWQDAFVKFWGALAARLSKFDPEMTLLEVVNEPVFNRREAEWNALNARLASAIREHAPRHTLVTSGPNWGGIDGLRKLQPLADRNVVYSFHCYDPFPFTHQGATWAGEDVKPLSQVPYPSSPAAVAPLLGALANRPGSRNMLEHYGREQWNKAKLAARFRQGVEWGVQQGVPLYCGEFGVFPQRAKPEHRANWFRDFGQVLAEHQIGWAVWGWDEGFGLNRRFVDGRPTVDTVVAQALGLKIT